MTVFIDLWIYYNIQMKKPENIEFIAILREVAPGQVIPHLLLETSAGVMEQAAPSYGYIIPEELLIPNTFVRLKKVIKGIRKGVDWEVEPVDNPDVYNHLI